MKAHYRSLTKASEFLRKQPTLATVPAYITSPEALQTVLAGAERSPDFLRIAETNRDKHRAATGHIDEETCEECGFYAGAVYDAQTGGRSLMKDMYGHDA